ncbi:MAG: prohibitin family protein [bacterium]
MFIFGIIIIVAVLIFRGSFKIKPEDRRFQDKLKARQFASFGGFALAAILIIASLIRIVPAGNIGVQVLFGKVLIGSTLSEGLNVVNPFIDLEIMTIRTQAYTMSIATEEGQRYGDDAITSLTKDGLEVAMDLTVWFHLDGTEAGIVFQKIGKDYVAKIVRPAARTAIRNTTVKYNAVEIYSEKREEVQTEINTSLAVDFKERGIILEKVLLRNIKLPAKVKNAIEAKLEADQDAQKMEFVLLKEIKEADRKKIEAGGIAEAQRIIAQSLIGERGRAYLSWKYLENLKNLYQSPNNTIVISPYDKSFIPLLQIR